MDKQPIRPIFHNVVCIPRKADGAQLLHPGALRFRKIIIVIPEIEAAKSLLFSVRAEDGVPLLGEPLRPEAEL